MSAASLPEIGHTVSEDIVWMLLVIACQFYKLDGDCEFDWGELYLTIGGRRMKLYLAVFTLAYNPELQGRRLGELQGIRIRKFPLGSLSHNKYKKSVGKKPFFPRISSFLKKATLKNTLHSSPIKHKCFIYSELQP